MRVGQAWKDWWGRVLDTIHTATGVDKATLNLLVLNLLGSSAEELYHRAQLISPFDDVREAAAEVEAQRQAERSIKNASENASA